MIMTLMSLLLKDKYAEPVKTLMICLCQLRKSLSNQEQISHSIQLLEIQNHKKTKMIKVAILTHQNLREILSSVHF